MLLSITTTHQPATDLGYLLHKHPDRVQSFSVPFGEAHVFYPEASTTRCTAALLLEIDPIRLVRGGGASGFALSQYVNDRPYVASSFMSTAIAQVYGTALNGTCRKRPSLVDTPIALEAEIAALPCRGGEALLRRLFEPLGYEVHVKREPLDPEYPAWGNSRYYLLRLDAVTRLVDLLTHLYVLVPVLDDDKHYYVGEDEVKKLLSRGQGWLETHPEQTLIAHRYLKHQRSLTRLALDLLAEDSPEVEDVDARRDAEEEAVEKPLSLHDRRLAAIVDALKARHVSQVADVGCGEGKLLRLLLKDRGFDRILGMDVSYTALEKATRLLKLDRLPAIQRNRIELIQGSVLYRDDRIAGFDAVTLVEVVEHIDPQRLDALSRSVLEFARPATVLITTPNAEYNALF
ncbi:MAG TPA: 3' terminal RNA ribose 2'-O-methyltransferase Hen1, partial [Candidatus Binatia bacterium]|nr:3' terminal RNA ribose 2'-O-methyltransferase Hen1 [Candidatus Binatia bacterium]